MSKRKPPRRTKHDYLVTFISHLGERQCTSQRHISMSAIWTAKNFPEVMTFLREANPERTDIVITNVFYMGRS